MENKLPNKLELFNLMLTKGTIFVHLVGNQCTFLPEDLQLKEQVVLQFGLNIPIPDLMVSEQGVSGTLSFKGKPQYVMVPWHAVFALVGEDTRGVVFPEEMTDSVKAEMTAMTSKPQIKPVPALEKTLNKYRTLDKTSNKSGLHKRPNHLRLVK
jgi:stringent starvation protein B